MSIKILADRMIDLSNEELKELNIDTISCFVNMGGKSYSDMEDIFPEDVFEHLDKTGKIAQTAAKSPETYKEFFKKFIDAGDTVIHLAVSSGISSIAENAKIAAQSFGDKAYVVDTKLLSNGIALLAKYALSLIENGENDAKVIVKKLEDKIPNIECSFLIDTLDCLYKGGRCSGVSFLMGNLLRIKPVIYMNKTGHMTVREKHRGQRNKTLENYVKTTFQKYPNPDLSQLYIAYTTEDEEYLKFVKTTVEKYHKFENIQFEKVGCNCAIHSGRYTIGLFFMYE